MTVTRDLARGGQSLRTLVVIKFVSLDGVMQASGAPDEDTEGGFRLFGRKTYEIMEALADRPDDDPFAKHLTSTAKYVASRTLQGRAQWQNAKLIKDDVVGEVSKLKGWTGKNIAVLGGGDLVVDEYFLTASPIVLGNGKRLFRNPHLSVRLRFVECMTTSTGSMLLTYRPARRGDGGPWRSRST